MYEDFGAFLTILPPPLASDTESLNEELRHDNQLDGNMAKKMFQNVLRKKTLQHQDSSKSLTNPKQDRIKEKLLRSASDSEIVKSEIYMLDFHKKSMEDVDYDVPPLMCRFHQENTELDASSDLPPSLPRRTEAKQHGL